MRPCGRVSAPLGNGSDCGSEVDGLLGICAGVCVAEEGD